MHAGLAADGGRPTGRVSTGSWCPASASGAGRCSAAARGHAGDHPVEKATLFQGVLCEALVYRNSNSQHRLIFVELKPSFAILLRVRWLRPPWAVAGPAVASGRASRWAAGPMGLPPAR
jgi:hypothetical protein